MIKAKLTRFKAKKIFKAIYATQNNETGNYYNRTNKVVLFD